ncbi:hypothetical protein ACF3NX_14080 (plasmid) [Acetobacter orientalis]|uniref:hypothetical protein n=1 Tax=Acetobacter orientalis TaxID=146474 RepID=UPI003863FEC7
MERINLASYDRIIVACSGGKDSVASLLHLLEDSVAKLIALLETAFGFGLERLS